MVYGRALGIIGCAAGLVLIACNLGTLFFFGSYASLLISGGLLFILMGITLIVFPGGEFKKTDYPNETIGFSFLWDRAPVTHRAIWISMFFASIVIAAALAIFLVMLKAS